MIEGSRYCGDVRKKHFNKEFVMTKEGIEDFENYMLAICWICDNNYIDTDVEVRDHCYVTANYRGSVHRDYNVNIELYHKITVISQHKKL